MDRRYGELIPSSYVDPLDLAEHFGRSAPLEVDLGCGDGGFLAQLAENHPERSFLGIERLAGRIGSASAKMRRRRLTNVRVLRVETSYAVRYLLPRKSVARFHILFPDPWPKQRHERRRLVTEGFLGDLCRALIEQGTVRLVTDQRDYFSSVAQLAMSSGLFESSLAGDSPPLPVTTFERKFIESGMPIYRLELRKALPSRCEVASQ